MDIVGDYDPPLGSLKHEQLGDVYQEAALNLRYKRITAITIKKLERVMELLQLDPQHLVERGLASRSSVAEDVDWSSREHKIQEIFPTAAPVNSDHSARTAAATCFQKNLSHQDDNEDDEWGVYEDNCVSDSEIDDDDDQDDEIEERRKGPIYAFLVYGGVQLRPDEYVLLFRALGVSPEYVKQFNHPDNSETAQKPQKEPLGSP